MCLEYGIGETTVRDIFKQKDKLLSFASSFDTSSMKKRKTMKNSSFEALDTALLEWVSQIRSEGTPISGPIVASKAKHFFELLGYEGNFDASSGWLTRFKQRHGIREVGLHGDQLSSDHQAAEDFKHDFDNFISANEYSDEQIYNADETGLFWKCLPKRTLAFQSENHTSGHKDSKERVTVMCCSNATGQHKLKLVFIGKAKKPRSFKGTRASNLPLDYYSQRKGWMDQVIFTDWFKKHFVPQVKDYLKSKDLPVKAVLLLDNCRAHPAEDLLKSDDGNIIVKYLPPNVTPLIQPMDQGVIATMKKTYKTSLLKRKIEEGCDLKEFWKEYTILDCIYDVAAAWETVKPVTLLRSWRKLMLRVEAESTDSTILDVEDSPSELAVLANSVVGGEDVKEQDITDWLNCDIDDPGFEHLTDEEIVARATGADGAAEDNEEEEFPAQTRIGHESALQHVEGLLEYLEGQEDSTIADKLILRKLQSQIKRKCFVTKKQKQVTDYFKKA